MQQRLEIEADDFGGGLAVLDAEEGVGDGEVEAAGTGAAGVQVEDSVVVLDGGLVGMAAEDDADACCLRIQIQIFERVNHVDEAAGEFDGLSRWEGGAGAVGVDVAADGGDGSDAG